MKDLTKGKILPLLLGFAVPIAVGNIFQLFYSLADTRIVGSFLGEEALAAVGATSSLNNMIIGFLLGMTNGFAIIVARYFGAKDHDNLKRAVAATFILGIGMAFVFTIVSVSLLRFILVGLQTPKNLLDLSVEYFRIILFGMTGAMLYNVVNIGLDLLFVCVFHLGVAGAAWATILSQYGSFACCFIYMRKRYDILLFGKKDCHLKRDMVKEMLSIGFSMGFMNSLINIGSVALQGAINSLQDTNYIVAHTAARKITEVFMLPFSVFGTTMATFCGQNLGAGKNDRIKKGLWRVIWITWAWCTGMIILAYTVAPVLVHLITDTTQVKVIATASLYLRMNTILYFIPAVICILRNAMQGIGDSITPVISSSLELLCKVLVAVFLTPYLGYWAIIWSEPISWVIMVIPLLIRIANNPVLKGNQTN